MFFLAPPFTRQPLTRICFVVLLALLLTLTGSNTLAAAVKNKPRVNQSDNVITFDYEFDEPEIIAQDDLDIVTIGGLENYNRAGEPVIPVQPAEILIPRGMKIANITSTATDILLLPGTYKLPLGRKPFRRLKGHPEKPPEPDTGISELNEFWPGKYHEMVTVQSNRGYQIAYVHLFPLQYLSRTGEIRAAGKLRLKVILVGRNNPHRTWPTPKLKNTLKRKIDNPDTLTSYDTFSDADSGIPVKSSSGSSPLSDPAGPYYGADYQYIVITSSALADERNIPDPAYSFQALCASKTARGIAAGVVTTDWIVANYDGTKPGGGSDNATRIRNFLIDAYQTWGTEYALLGGNKDVVPVRMFADSGESIPADLYYGCVDPLENTFDGDGDGKYGESKDGVGGAEVDLTAEIFTGRAAVENGREVVNFVRKTLTYGSTQDDYLNVAATMGSHLGFGNVQEFTKPFGELIRLGSDLYLGHFTHGLESPNIPDARDFTVVTLYDEDWYNDNHEPDFDHSGSVNWDSYQDGWSATNDLLPILNEENGHTTPQIIYISDHGDTRLGMVKLYSYSTGAGKYNHLGNLKNTNPFFFYDDSCYVGAYDEDDSFGEEITSMEHGAFATILNSRYGWGSGGNNLDSPSTQFTREFFESVLGEGILELGRAHQEAKESNLWRLYTSFWGIRYVYYELNLFGDPELRLRVTAESACSEGDTRPTTCGTGACASTGTETCIDGLWGGDTCEPGTPDSEMCTNLLDDDCDGSVDESECAVDTNNQVLTANGGVLESFTSEYGSGWDASDLTNGIAHEAGWSSGVDPGPQQFVYAFRDGRQAALSEAVIYGGTGEGQYYSKDVEVWLSADGSSYTLAGSGRLADTDNAIVSIDLGSTAARKVKLVITSGYRSDYWELAEFVVRGELIGSADADGDGVADSADNCPNQANASQADTDGDGLGDACDPLTDSDGDGVEDSADNCPNSSNASQADGDGDGLGDACDPLTDSDGDGVEDSADNCPNDTNASQADGDGDGLGDACDPLTDSDGDGVKDASDNCPNEANANQADADGDGLGDVCDPLTDSDGDGMPDDWETRNGLDPNRDDAAADPDDDGISNLDEYLGATDPAVYDGNEAPEAPLPYAPAAHETVSLTPQLETEEFYDPDPGDTHRRTQWQIIRQADARVVLDIESADELTSLPVPTMVLDGDTGYSWRARFFDNHGFASQWSQTADFVTALQTKDSDGNGILDDQEVDPGLDLDDDGRADMDQTDIKCVNIQGADGQVGISIADSATVAAIDALEAMDANDAQFDGRYGGKPEQMPFGLIHFKLRVNEAGAEAAVTVHLSGPAPAGSKWYKFDPITETWLDYSDYAELSSDRRSVRLTVTDGGPADLDGVANGIIIDPSGLGAPAASLDEGGDSSAVVDDSTSDLVDSAPDNHSSKSGCFIAAAAQQPQTRRSATPWVDVRARYPAIPFLLLMAVAASRRPQ